MTIGAIGGYTGSNHLTISRMQDGSGNILVSAQNMQNTDMGFIGEVTGNVNVVLGSTDGGYGTEHQVYATSGTRININDASQNISFNNSNNISLFLVDNDNEANIQFNNVNNSTLDATGTSRAANITTSADSNHNVFNFGWGDASIIDGGSYNVTSLGSGNAYYASLTSSKGAVVFGGSGNSSYQIAGNYGVFQQGTGAAVYQINSITGNNQSGYMNAILSTGGGVSSITDQGRYSLLVSDNPSSTVIANGYGAVGKFGSLARVEIRENAKDSFFFAGSSWKHVDTSGKSKDGSDTSFALNKSLYNRGWRTLGKGDYFATSGHDKDFISSYTNLLDILEIGNSYKS